MNKEIFKKRLSQYASTEGCIESLVERLKREGFSRLNGLLLEKALSKLPTQAVKLNTPLHKESFGQYKQPSIIQTQQPITDNQQLSPGDILAIDMRKLIGEKNKLANTFWDNQNSPQKCKGISIRVLAMESDIERMRERLRYFNEKGQMPDEPQKLSDADKLPETKYELSKKISSIRVMIVQVQDELELATLNGDKKKVDNREKRLVELKNLRDVAETKLKNAIV
jgi:hypothetical protein